MVSYGTIPKGYSICKLKNPPTDMYILIMKQRYTKHIIAKKYKFRLKN